MEYFVGDCKVISNQRGYPEENQENLEEYLSFTPKIIEI
jgi:hypothetical protein